MSETIIYLVRLKQRHRLRDNLADPPRKSATNALFQSRGDAELYCQHTLPPIRIYPFSWDQTRRVPRQQQLINLLADYMMPPLWPSIHALPAHYSRIPWMIFCNALELWWETNKQELTVEQYRAIWRFADPEPYEIVPISLNREADAGNHRQLDEIIPRELLERYENTEGKRRGRGWSPHNWLEPEIPEPETPEFEDIEDIEDDFPESDAPWPLSLQMGEELQWEIDLYPQPTEEESDCEYDTTNQFPEPLTNTRKVYIVQRLNWCFSDEGDSVYDDEPIHVFADRATAKRFREHQELLARLDFPPPFDPEEEMPISPIGDLNEEDRSLPPYSDPEFHRKYFEVVEVEVEIR